MNRRVALGLVSFCGLVLVAVLVVWWLLPSQGDEAVPVAGLTESSERPSDPTATETLEVDLYFPAQDGALHTESRLLAQDQDALRRAKSIIEEVLAGPRTPHLRAPLPAGVVLAGVDLAEDGVIYVDLRSPDGGSPPPSGSRREMLMVYSLVDSLSLNLPEVERVALLWNGRQSATFAGHLDTTQPLAPDMSLVASSSRRPR